MTKGVSFDDPGDPPPRDDQERGRPPPPEPPPGEPAPAVQHRVPPHDVDAEMALLGSLLLDGSMVEKVRASRFFGDEFYRTSHKRLFGVLLSLHDRGLPTDPLLVIRELESRDLLEEIGGKPFLASLAECVPTAANAVHYATIVRDLAKKRAHENLALEIGAAARNGTTTADLDAMLERGFERIKIDHPEAGGPSRWLWRSIDEILDIPEDASPHLWEGVVAIKALTLFAAAPKCGKTWISLAFAAALVNDLPWLAQPALGRRVRVLLVSEEPDFIIQGHALRFGIGRGAPFHVLTTDKMPAGYTWADLTREAFNRAEELGAEVVLFDTISTLANILDENDQNQVNAALRPLSSGAKSSRVAVLVIHHMSAGGRIRGSTVFEAVPDMLVTADLEGAEGTRKRALLCKGRLQRKPEGKFLIEYVGRQEGEPAAYKAIGTTRDRKVALALANARKLLLAAPGWLSGRTVCDLVPGTDSDIRKALKLAVTDGAIHQRTAPGQAGGGGVQYAGLDVPGDGPTLTAGAIGQIAGNVEFETGEEEES